jgi:hypothetical protein
VSVTLGLWAAYLRSVAWRLSHTARARPLPVETFNVVNELLQLLPNVSELNPKVSQVFQGLVSFFLPFLAGKPEVATPL